jgi:hypothetical protein
MPLPVTLRVLWLTSHHLFASRLDWRGVTCQSVFQCFKHGGNLDIGLDIGPPGMCSSSAVDSFTPWRRQIVAHCDVSVFVCLTLDHKGWATCNIRTHSPMAAAEKRVLKFQVHAKKPSALIEKDIITVREDPRRSGGHVNTSDNFAGVADMENSSCCVVHTLTASNPNSTM